MRRPTKKSGSSSKRRKQSTKKSMAKLRGSPKNLKKRNPRKREMIFPLTQNSQVMLSSGSLRTKGKKSSAPVKSKPYGIVLTKRTKRTIKKLTKKTNKSLMKIEKSGKVNMAKDPRRRLLRRTRSQFQSRKNPKEARKAKEKITVRVPRPKK